MGLSTSDTAATIQKASMTKGLVLLFAFCCGAIVANIYYAQPIISLIAPDIGMSSGSASFIVSLTQIGYALGLFFLVPLADLVENRRLMIATIVITIFSLVAAGLSKQPSVFLVVSALIGFSSVSVQMLIPLAAHLAPEESRGRVVGGIMGGLLLGISACAAAVESGCRSFGLARSVYRGRCLDARYLHRDWHDHAQMATDPSRVVRSIVDVPGTTVLPRARAASARTLSRADVCGVQFVLDRRAADIES